MTAQTIALVVNPSAGKGRAAKQVAAVAGRLRESGANVSILVGADAQDAVTVTRKAVADGVDAVVALGGDGMVHLALNAVAGTDTPLGIVPAGTGNDLAATLGLPKKDPVAAAGIVADRLRDDAAWAMDAIKVGDKWFGCVLGAGFDSRVNDRANRMTWPKGKSRYNIAMLAELGVFAPLPFELVVDGEAIKTDAMLVAIGNAKSYGAGMKVTPDADVTDGLMDVMVLGPVSKPEFLKTFPKVFKGTHITHPAVTMRKAKVVELSSPGVTAYADGEYLADLPIRCECVKGAVRVLA
ncbi:MAG TPA: diacylglycerol kinase [Mycobacteriales bacterium]|jgi:diacylglycerol kinase (ATP)|nr:diacylglycerol kinase [Mycobacteriales bacterium]